MTTVSLKAASPITDLSGAVLNNVGIAKRRAGKAKILGT